MNTIEWLIHLISFDTTSRNSNLKLIETLQDWFSTHQVEMRLTYSADSQKANLLATIPGTLSASDGGLILSGHTDVVPVDHQIWERDPFSAYIKDERIYGRGAADMKGFLAVILSLVPAIQNLSLSYPVHFAFSYDEEVGCIGAPLLIADLLQKKITPKACIVGEPTGLRGVIAHKGIQVFKCRLHGHATHSSLITEGSNAVEHAAQMITSIRQLAIKLMREGPFDQQFDVPFSTLTTNKIEGGIALNIIPDLCEFFVELRYLPKEKVEEIVDQLNRIVQRELKVMQSEASECEIEWERLAAVPSFETNSKSSLIQLISQISSESPYKVAYATEAGLFNQANIETIIWGPGHIANAHGSNEYISIDQLEKCERDLIEILRRGLGRGGSKKGGN